MTKDEIIERMNQLGFTRQTLAEASGYRYEYIRNSLTPNAPEPSPKFVAAVARAFSEKEQPQRGAGARGGESIWDLVTFSGRELAAIDQARQLGGYQELAQFYRDAVIAYADQLLEQERQETAVETPAVMPDLRSVPYFTRESDLPRTGLRVADGDPVPYPRRKQQVEPVGGKKGAAAEAESLVAEEEDTTENVVDGRPHFLELLGGVAAGAPIAADAPQDQKIPVAESYPEDHYALRVYGRSMEPRVRDGATIVVRCWQGQGMPRKGTIVVYSDGHGATLKEFGYRKAKAGEEADTFGNVAVLRSLNKAFPDVQTHEGGRIDAVLVGVCG